MSVRPGTRLDGRYRLSDRLAYGGMGEVWRASDEVLSREVAVKILRPELAEDEAFVRRFRAEARTTSGLPHNGIAAVYDYGETRVGADGQSPAPYDDPDADPVAYLVMELVPGEALSSTLSRDGALGPELTLDLVAQAARALHAAHLKGVIHRDIKPANLMVTPEGRVKVTDFGIARPLDHEPLTATGQVMGTAHYLAPELAKGQDASPLSDVYALGVVAYECLAGHRPFEGDNQVAVALAHLNEEPPPLPGTIPAQVRAVVGSAMAKDPQRRMPSAEAFAAALETLRYRQATDDHMTPGTGIIPGSPAHEGLSAAGVYGTTQAGGWTPGAGTADGSYGGAMAASPVPAAAPQPGTGAHRYGPATSGQARAGVTGGMPSANAGTADGAGRGGQPSAYASSGQGDYADYGYGGGRPGGDGYGGGYGSPRDPFRTPTAPGGISVTPGRRPRQERSLSGPLLLAAGIGTLLVIVLLVWIFMRPKDTSNTIPDVKPPASSPAATAPVGPTATPTSKPTSSVRPHTSRSSSTTSSSSKSTSKSPTPTPTSSPAITGLPPTTTTTSDPTTTSTSDTTTTTTTTTTTSTSTAKGSTAPSNSSNPTTTTSAPGPGPGPGQNANGSVLAP